MIVIDEIWNYLQLFEPDQLYDNTQDIQVPADREAYDMPETAFASSPPSFVPPPTRSGRTRKFPAFFKDFLPTSTSRVPHTRIPHMPPPPQPQKVLIPPRPSPPSSTVTSVSDEEPEQGTDSTFTTEPDEFGLFRVYPRKPYREPDNEVTLDDICEDAARAPSDNSDSRRWWKGFNPDMDDEQATPMHPFAPLSSPTSFRILNWFYGGSRQKSQAELNSLLENVLRAEDFSLDEVGNFKLAHEMALLDSVDDPSAPFANENIWKKSTIRIPLPCEREKFPSEDAAHKLRIRDVRYRSLLEVMRTGAKDESAKSWHNTLYKMFWKPSTDSQPQRIISELYTADAFLEEHEKIAKLPLHLLTDPPGLKPVENAVFAIMLWSDSTHLANFGDASMWPIYLYSGNQSKYPRGRPSQHSAHHVAHIPSVNFYHLYISTATYEYL